MHQWGPSMDGDSDGTRHTEAAWCSSVAASISGFAEPHHSSGPPAGAAQTAQAPVPVLTPHGASKPHSCQDPPAGAALAPCLFAMPVESNFSGQRYDLALVQQVQQQGLACPGAAPSGCGCPPTGRQGTAPAPAQQQALPGCLPGRQSSEAPVQGKDTQARPAGSQSTDVSVQGQGLLRHPVPCAGCPCALGELPEAPHQAEGLCQAEQSGSSQPGRLGQAPIEQVCTAPAVQHGTEGDGSAQRGHPLGTPGRQQAGEPTGDQCCMQQEGAAQQRWLVLLDAAKACGTSPPDLSRHAADFVVSDLRSIGFLPPECTASA